MTKFKKFKNLFYTVSFVLIGSILYGASNIFNDMWTINGVGTLKDKAVAYIDSSYGFFLQDDGATPDFSVQSGNTYIGNRLQFGSLGVAVSTSNTAGATQASTYNAFLGASPLETAVVEGELLCASTPTITTNYVSVKRCEPNVGLTTFVGVSAAAASTGAVVAVYDSGWVLTKSTGVILFGDMVQVSTFAGVAIYSPYSTSSIGVALDTQANATGGNRIRIKLR